MSIGFLMMSMAWLEAEDNPIFPAITVQER